MYWSTNPALAVDDVIKVILRLGTWGVDNVDLVLMQELFTRGDIGNLGHIDAEGLYQVTR